VKQTVIVKVGETEKPKRRRRSAPRRRAEEPINMQMSLPPPVIYQTGPAFNQPQPQPFQIMEYPRFGEPEKEAGKAAIRREEESKKTKTPVLEDIGLLGSAEIIDVKNKREQLSELGDLVPLSNDEFSMNAPFGISPASSISQIMPDIQTPFASPKLMESNFPEPAKSAKYAKSAPSGYYSESEGETSGQRPIRISPQPMQLAPSAKKSEELGPPRDFPPNDKTLTEYARIFNFEGVDKRDLENRFFADREAWRFGLGRVGRKSELKLTKKSNSNFIKSFEKRPF